jgi:hypothetical protein
MLCYANCAQPKTEAFADNCSGCWTGASVRAEFCAARGLSVITAPEQHSDTISLSGWGEYFPSLRAPSAVVSVGIGVMDSLPK